MLYFSIVGKLVAQEIWENRKRLENENKVYRKGHETVGYSETGHEPNTGNENQIKKYCF